MSRLFIALALFVAVVNGVPTIINERLPSVAAKATINETWLGSWMSTNRTENMDALIVALGPHDFLNEAIKDVEHTFSKKGDLYRHDITLPAMNITRGHSFRLGQQQEVTFPNGHVIKRMYTEVGDKLVVDLDLTVKAKHLRDVYEVIGDELLKTSTIGTVEAKRYFTKAVTPRFYTPVYCR